MDPPLDGVKVLDVGRLMPGSIATAELARLGAEVVKVEVPPFGDYLRVNPPLIEGRGDMHLHINRGKKSICVDLRSSRGRDVLDRLVTWCDVLVEVSRPGAGASLGLDRERLQELKADLVHCSITGFGHTGPYAHLGAHGLSADAAAGLLAVERKGGRWLLPDPYVSVGPRAAGLHAAIAIMAALLVSQRSGRGSFIDISQWDAAVSWNYRSLALAANGQGTAPAYRNLGPKYDLYETADHRLVLLCVPEERLWRTFCQTVDRQDLIGEPSGSVVEYAEDEDLRRELAAIFLGRTRDEWAKLGVETGFVVAPVIEAEELVDDPHVEARRMVEEVEHPLGGTVKLPGAAVKWDGQDRALTPAPELGEHSCEVLRAVGYGDEEIARLLDDGTVR